MVTCLGNNNNAEQMVSLIYDVKMLRNRLSFFSGVVGVVLCVVLSGGGDGGNKLFWYNNKQTYKLDSAERCWNESSGTDWRQLRDKSLKS